ncbi:MAG: hypothetical protein JSS49_09040 [Planctomycetes bacterium]|nr:hypothetical protein [Planctomycetota bacterium]
MIPPVFLRSRISLIVVPFVIAAMSWISPVSIHGQVEVPDPVEELQSVPLPADSDGPQVASSTPTATSDAAKAKAERKTRRLQQIKQLNFDRRPTAILKAWQTPPPVEPVMEAIEETSGSSADSPTVTADVKPAEAPKNEPKTVDATKPGATTTPEETAAAAKKAEQAQKEQAARQAADAKRKAAEDAAFQRELTKLQRHVTLAEWTDVRQYIANLEAEEAKALYSQMITSLQSGAIGRMNIEPNMLQQLVTQGADIYKIQQTLSSMGQGPGAAYLEKNLFTMPDVLGLLLATPGELDDDVIRKAGMILLYSINSGFDLDALLAEPPIVEAKAGPKLARVEPAPAVKTATGTADKPTEVKETLPRSPYQLTARDIARLLCAARQEPLAGDYLPTLDEAKAAQDGPGLNLVVRHVLSKYTKDQQTVGLEQAWQATQAVLEIPMPPEPPADSPSTKASPANEANDSETLEATKPDLQREYAKKQYLLAKSTRDEALTRAVELAPKIRKELGQSWLDDSFQQRIERGKELLTAIGSATSGNLSSRPQDSEYRKRGLELQQTAVDALLRGSREQAKAWRDPLTVMAVAWLKEASTSHQLDNSAGMRGWRRDRYGNYFMFDDDYSPSRMSYGGGGASPIKIEEMLELKPAQDWLDLITDDLKPRFHEMFAQLHLKMQDEALAFPYIERLATSHPRRAKDLAEEFVRVWTSTHNPNEKRDGYNPYMYYFAYERRADRIPLTRSKQERNLVELAAWIKRIQALPIESINETLLTNAFTTAHSRAEVYRLEAIESVFGSIDALKPRTLAELIQQMRGNLATVWRMPDVQRQNSTNRKQRDIRAEVEHGYAVSREVVKRGLERHPGHWALILADAALLHDEIEYEKEAEKSSDFSTRRSDAFDLFAKSAAAYVAAVPEIPVDEQTVLPFEMWFYASLGSVDLARITPDKSADLRQPALIRAALATLTGEPAERHLSQFANNLFTRASDAKPELKQRYLKAGFEVVGDHKLAREARKLHDYYSDLVTEIKLETRLDGPDSVGHGKPFGVFVNLLHTKEIERESGGFGKYLQNQQNSQMYFYNFGRPLENYRDKFREFATKALDEHFEVLSVTFQEASVNSRALPEYGWRSTPYAYLLLKSKGPEVDKLASLRMDFDFLDTSGYAVLPVESPMLPLDSKSDNPPSRPAEDIVIMQTLDERQSDKGKLLLEIRATSRGLAPELDQLLDLNSPGFSVEKIDDRGVSVLEFDKESSENAIRSERQWMVSLAAAAKPDGKRPATFKFGSARLPVKESVYQRYVDADLKSVPAEVLLEARYGKSSSQWLLWLVLGSAVALIVAAAFWRGLAGRPSAPEREFTLPANLTPFTALGFLKDLDANAGFDEASRLQLAESISAIEQHYFQMPLQTPPDLDSIANRWLQAALKG